MKVYPSLYIGLGGTGRVIAALIKDQFRRTFEAKSKGIPPIIRFLAIDGDRARPSDLPESLDLESNEILFVDVNLGTVENEIRTSLRGKNLSQDPVWGWYEFGLRSRLKRFTTSSGAGQIRKFSRVQLFYRYSDIKGSLTDLVNAIGEARPQIEQEWGIEIGTPLHCFILASIAGGTGSGSFWDVAMWVKSLRPEAYINLILLTPDFFIGDILDANQDTSLLLTNAYAALKELNYFAKERKFRQLYSYDEAPLDLSELWPKERSMDFRIFILTNRNEAGDVVGDRFHMAQLIANFCFYFTCADVTSFLDGGRTNDHDFGEEWSYIAVPEPQPLIFSSFGLSQIIFPKEFVLPLLKIRALREVLSHALDSDELLRTAREEIEEGRREMIEGRERRIPPFLERGITPHLREPDVRLCDFERTFRADNVYKNKKRVKEILQGEKERMDRLLSQEPTRIWDYTDLFRTFKSAINQFIQSELESGRNWNYVKGFLRLLIEKEEVLNNLYDRQKDFQVDNNVKEKEIKEKEKAYSSALKDLDIHYPKGLLKTWGRTRYHIRRVYERIRDYGRVIMMYKQKEAIYKFYEEAIAYVGGLLRGRIGTLERHLQDLRASLTEDERKIRREIDQLGGGWITKVKASEGEISQIYDDYLREIVNNEKESFRRQIIAWLDLENREWTIDPREVEGWILKEGERMLHVSGVKELNLRDLISEEDLKKLLFRHYQEHTEAFFYSGFKRDVATNLVKEYKYVLSKQDLPTTDIESVKVEEMDPNSIVFIQIKDTMPIYRLGDLEQYFAPYNTHVKKEKSPEKRYTFVHLNREALDFPELLVSPDIEVLIEIAWKLGILGRTKSGGPILWKGRQGEERYPSRRKLKEAFEQDPTLEERLEEDILYVLQDKPREEVRKFLTENEELFDSVYALAQKIRTARGL